MFYLWNDVTCHLIDGRCLRVYRDNSVKVTMHPSSSDLDSEHTSVFGASKRKKR